MHFVHSFVWLAWLQVPMAQAASWCDTGIHQLNFVSDADQPSIDVIVAQSPLFASNPKIGKKLGWFNMYHTALVLSQRIPGQAAKNWTVEFDSVTNVLGAVLPEMNGTELTWNNDARFCITEGVLWGEAHWSKTFEVAMRITASQAHKVIQDFVMPLNSSVHHEKPLYQLWKVVKRDKEEEILVRDITCGDGVNWFLNYANKALGVQLESGFSLSFTSIVFRVDRVEPVKTDNATEWAKVIKYFQEVVEFAAKGESILQRGEILLKLMPLKYVYDSNSKTYFEAIGDSFPWFSARFDKKALEGPPWTTASGKMADDSAALVV
eukprot:TRINITY_DN42073_c0_g1_i1.p2 TRINITY_DN42073_c0_g1~~TRINITY_DN42073_c0_g1_i1.p2  ORF type:complete len:322 (+),score=74.47 TRINITY_DN42073_c0_g1_i1:67-1032(+)